MWMKQTQTLRIRMAQKVQQSRTLLTGLQTEYNMRLEAEQALSDQLRQLFTKTEQQVLKAYLKLSNADDILVFQVQQILKPLFDIEPVYNQTVLDKAKLAMQNGRKSTLNLINLQLKKDYKLFDFDPQIYKNLSNQTFIASEHTLERVRGNVMQNVSQSYAEGLGIKDAARKLHKEFQQIQNFEVNRIARTEINSAQNAGAFQTYYDYGIEYHQWWTGQDARVRDSHKSMQGEIVKVGNTFSNGLLRPGDRTGRIKEWINCRCTTVPYLMPLGYMAPIGRVNFKEPDIIPIPNFEIPRINL